MTSVQGSPNPMDKLSKTLRSEEYMKQPVHFDSRLFQGLRNNLEVSVRRLGHIIGKLKNKPENEPTLAYLKKKWKSNDKIVLKLVNRLNAVEDGDPKPLSNMSNIEIHLTHADNLVNKFKDSIDPSSKNLFDQALISCRSAIEKLKAQAKLAQEPANLTQISEVSLQPTMPDTAETTDSHITPLDTGITSEMDNQTLADNLAESLLETELAAMEPLTPLRRITPQPSPKITPASPHESEILEVEAPMVQRQVASQENIPKPVQNIMQKFTEILKLFENEKLEPLAQVFQEIVQKDLDKLKSEWLNIDKLKDDSQSIGQFPEAFAAFKKDWEDRAKFLKDNVEQIEELGIKRYAEEFSTALSEELLESTEQVKVHAEKTLAQLRVKLGILSQSGSTLQSVSNYVLDIEKLEEIRNFLRYDIDAIDGDNYLDINSLKLHKEKIKHIQQYYMFVPTTKELALGRADVDFYLHFDKLEDLQRRTDFEKELYQAFKAHKSDSIGSLQSPYSQCIRMSQFVSAYRLKNKVDAARHEVLLSKRDLRDKKTLMSATNLLIAVQDAKKTLEESTREIQSLKTASSTDLLQQAEHLKDKDAPLASDARRRFIQNTQEAQKQLLEKAQTKLQACESESKSAIALAQMIKEIKAAKLPATSKVKMAGFHIMGGNQIKLPSATYEQLRAWEKHVKELQQSFDAFLRTNKE